MSRYLTGVSLILLLFLLAFGGCLSDDEAVPASSTDDPSSGESDPWGDRETITIVEISSDRVSARADVLCTFGGGFKLPRTQGSILPGTERLSVEVETDLTYTGFQVGHVVDANGADHAPDVNGSIQWLDTVRGNDEFGIPVSLAQAEAASGDERWDFYGRLNLDPAEQDCYTGAGTGRWSVTVTAIRGN